VAARLAPGWHAPVAVARPGGATPPTGAPIHLAAEVADALRDGRPVVAGRGMSTHGARTRHPAVPVVLYDDLRRT